MYQHLSRYIHDCISVVDYGTELLLKTFPYYLGQRVSVYAVSLFHARLSQSFLSSLYLRRKFSLRHRQKFIYLICYKIGVLYDYFSGSVGAQVRKFFHHFVGSSKIEALAAFGILISLARHYDVSVYGGSIPVIMSVGSCNYRLTHLFA